MDVSALRFLIEQDVNYFMGVWDNDCSKTTSIEDILVSIRDGIWKDEVEMYQSETDKKVREELKKQFIGVTFSGTFKDARLDRNLFRYNYILVVDIDLKDLKISPESAMEIVCQIPFIFAAFRSPSGGIKALAFSRMKHQHHKVFFAGVENYFKYNHDIQIDPSGKNPGRLCFISYDPNLYLSHEGKEPFDLKKHSPKVFNIEASKRFKEVGNIDYSKYEESKDLKYIFDIAKKRAVNNVGAYHKGNRNNYIFTLSCILNRAGVHESIASDIILQTYPSLGQEEIQATVKSAYSHNRREHGSNPIFERKSGQSSFFLIY